MVQLLQCCSAHMPSRPLVFSILLLIASSVEAAHSDARRLPLELSLSISTTTKEQQDAAAIRVGMEGRRALIGSRPPRCERACVSCGHCEAVQVPIVPQEEQHHQKRATAAVTAAAMFTYRVNGITNYKPLSWKCRCGGTILDP